MKILHTVEAYYPEIGGMPEVVKQLSERLVLLGHEVTVATRKSSDRTASIINGVSIKEFTVNGNFVEGITGDVDVYKQFLLTSNFDIITNFAAQQWATDLALPLLSQLSAKKVFVPTGFSGLFWPGYQDYYEKMKTWMKGYDSNVFLSGSYRDIDFARKNNIANTILIPNGASADEFLPSSKIDIRKKLGIPAEAFLILHVGSYTGIKGHAEAIRIYLKSKIKDGVLLFIGNKNTDFVRYTKLNKRFILWKIAHLFPQKKYLITLLNREETVAAYKAADLFLFPSKIECSPIVLFEAMASETAFLTTDAGNAKEIIEWSKAGELLPTLIDEQGFSCAKINESVQLLNNLYDHPQKRNTLAKNGLAAWKKKFSWEIIVKQYEELYLNLLTNKK